LFEVLEKTQSVLPTMSTARSKNSVLPTMFSSVQLLVATGINTQCST